ncbi:TPA: hypothetical protein ACN37W_004101 [Vibrio parahaemolyticus]
MNEPSALGVVVKGWANCIKTALGDICCRMRAPRMTFLKMSRKLVVWFMQNVSSLMNDIAIKQEGHFDCYGLNVK